MKIHFIGCNGVSMNMLMKLSESFGHTVSGSDLMLGGHNPSHVTGCDAAVFSGAVHEDNVELQQARRLGIPCIERSEFLGQIADNYQKVLAVAGAHGKTTVTGMIYYLFRHLDPTLHIGGELDGKRGVISGRKIFITEACEYRRSFLSLFPDIGIILNIALDHTDYYRDYEDIMSAFEEFARHSRKLIIYGDEVYNIRHADKLTFGFSAGCDICAQECRSEPDCTCIRVSYRGDDLGEFTTPLRGLHNVKNVLAAISAGLAYDLPIHQIKEGIAQFKGVSRRMELLATHKGTAYYSDYAHHPDEICATVQSLKVMGYAHPLIIFQPHTYTRTLSFLDGFAKALKETPLELLPIYAAREEEVYNISSTTLMDRVNAIGGKAELIGEESLKFLDFSRYDAVVFMGAGSIDAYARETVKNLLI